MCLLLYLEHMGPGCICGISRKTLKQDWWGTIVLNLPSRLSSLDPFSTCQIHVKVIQILSDSNSRVGSRGFASHSIIMALIRLLVPLLSIF